MVQQAYCQLTAAPVIRDQRYRSHILIPPAKEGPL
jgi:hypothetical protein